MEINNIYTKNVGMKEDISDIAYVVCEFIFNAYSETVQLHLVEHFAKYAK